METNLKALYGKIEYWEERYTRSLEPFDWYQVYDGVKDIITQYIRKSDKILNIGCGNSKLSEEMYEYEYENIANIDYSTKVIAYMEERCKTKCPNMTFKVMNVLDMDEFKKGEFDVVLDKGCLDSVLSGDNSVPNAEQMMNEIFRVLAPGGYYICITYGDPDHRKKYLVANPPQWTLTIDKVAKPSSMMASNINPDENDVKNFHYIYTMLKPK